MVRRKAFDADSPGAERPNVLVIMSEQRLRAAVTTHVGG